MQPHGEAEDDATKERIIFIGLDPIRLSSALCVNKFHQRAEWLLAPSATAAEETDVCG